MKITQMIATTYMKFSKWTFVHEELPPKVIAIGVPHTSNWDAWMMVMAFWKVGRPIKFLVKDQAANAPVLGPIVRAIGGVATDRSASHGLVGSLVHEAESAETYTLIIAPKGTRSPRKYWKSGFYRIALETGMPIQLGFIDRTTKTYGWAGTYEITGDVVADMEALRTFYAGKVGQRPQNTSVPRLRAEDDAEARAWLLGEA